MACVFTKIKHYNLFGFQRWLKSAKYKLSTLFILKGENKGVFEIAQKCKMISLDTSSSKTGWAYFLAGKYKKSGVIDLDTKECKKKYQNNSDKRIEDMCLAVLELLQKHQPDIIVIEKLNVSRNMNAVRVLSKVIGAVYTYYIMNDDCFYFEIQPTQWRSQLGMQSGKKKRDELKQLSVEYVKNTLGIDVTDDEADSICAGIAYIKMFT